MNRISGEKLFAGHIGMFYQRSNTSSLQRECRKYRIFGKYWGRMGDQDDANKVIDCLLSVLVFCGWALLISSVFVTIGILFGLTDVNQFSVRGTSGLRSIAAIAILGCLSAAIGYMKEE
jgi:hypothetical protein